jgi:hypothetical protein
MRDNLTIFTHHLGYAEVSQQSFSIYKMKHGIPDWLRAYQRSTFSDDALAGVNLMTIYA